MASWLADMLPLIKDIVGDACSGSFPTAHELQTSNYMI
jgi:hypothetical protein